jgi:hypothetical protein
VGISVGTSLEFRFGKKPLDLVGGFMGFMMGFLGLFWGFIDPKTKVLLIDCKLV